MRAAWQTLVLCMLQHDLVIRIWGKKEERKKSMEISQRYPSRVGYPYNEYVLLCQHGRNLTKCPNSDILCRVDFCQYNIVSYIVCNLLCT